ncbi:MAG: AraC family transcriptional regulator [Polyangiaceae bacterium]|nr:AraC family transcriptional regulator [Polyangiaceae bacterium]
MHDPLSDVLRLTDAESVMSGGFAAGGRWALRFPPPKKIKFFALTRGTCLLRVDGEKNAATFEPGDVFLATGRKGFVFASSPGTEPRDARRVFARDTFVTIGDGADHVFIAGHVSLNPSNGALLTDVLPPTIHVRAASPQAAMLHWIVEHIVHERGSSEPGSAVVSAQLAQLLFVQIVRAHLADASLPPGWLRAVADVRIAPAMRLMHAEPAREWTVEELAKAAAMSRTTFADRFKSVAGVAPLTYLTQWRMHLAQRRLRDHDESILELAESLGYASESSFSNAFKRVIGIAPRNYRLAARR